MVDPKALAQTIVDAWIAGGAVDVEAVRALPMQVRKRVASAAERRVRSKQVRDRVDEAKLTDLTIKAIEFTALVELTDPRSNQTLAAFMGSVDDE